MGPFMSQEDLMTALYLFTTFVSSILFFRQQRDNARRTEYRLAQLEARVMARLDALAELNQDSTQPDAVSSSYPCNTESPRRFQLISRRSSTQPADCELS